MAGPPGIRVVEISDPSTPNAVHSRTQSTSPDRQELENIMPFALTAERDKQVEALLARYPNTRAALIPVLWVCQRQHGWISPEVIDWVAQRLDLSTASVKGVVTFYTMFFDKPVGEHVIWVCRTLSCDLRGGKAIQEHLEKRLGCHAGGTSADGKFSLMKAECLAACGQAPMVQIDDDYHENLTVESLDRILDSVTSASVTSASVTSASVGSTPAQEA